MSILSIALSVRKLNKADQKIILETQHARLNAIVKYARKNSPYFSQLYRNLPSEIADITQLPITEKHELINHFNDWVTDKELKLEDLRSFISKTETIGDMYRNQYYVCTTSGTTGEPAIIIHDQHSRQVYNCIGLLRLLLTRISLFDIFTKFKTAAIFATGGHFLGYTTLMNQIKKSALRQKTRKIFSVFMPIAEMVQQLNIFKPNIIGGYPTAIYLLAKEKLHGKLSIKPFLILSAGETLKPYMRKIISQAFNAEIINNYGSSEVPGLTSECKFHKLHVNTDWYILEAIDENNNSVPAGEQSTAILVTNLSNFVQPIIRYKMSDSVTFISHSCECGSSYPVIEVIGRSEEILHFTNSSRKPIDILPLAISTIAEETDEVYQAQIIQKTSTHLSVRIKALESKNAAEVNIAVKTNLKKYLETQGLSNVTIEIEDKNPEINPKSGKFRSILTDLI